MNWLVVVGSAEKAMGSSIREYRVLPPSYPKSVCRCARTRHHHYIMVSLHRAWISFTGVDQVRRGSPETETVSRECYNLCSKATRSLDHLSQSICTLPKGCVHGLPWTFG